MKINNKSEKTLTLYNSSIEYEPGDFVVLGNTIYICEKISKGIDPTSTEGQNNFKTYLGNDLINLDEFLEFVEKGQGSVGYVDVNTLYSILNYFMDGFTNKGVIGNWIEYDGTDLKTNLTFSRKESILCDIMQGEVNNSIYRVDRRLPEIEAYVNQVSDIKCLLKQYTYKENNETLVRIQELIDPDCGLIYYRWIKKSKSASWPTPGPFSCSVVNGVSIKRRLDEITTLYTNRLNTMETLEKSMKENFRYNVITPTMTEIADLYELDKSKINDSKQLNILLRRSDPDNVFESSEVPVLIDFEVGQSVVYKSQLSGVTIQINNQTNKYTIRISDSSVSIPSIIYREYYD